MRLDRRDRPFVERPQVGEVMVRQRQEPPEAVEVSVVGVASGGAGVRLDRELDAEPPQRSGGLVGERGYARPVDGRRSGSRLTRRPRFLSLRETKGDECDAAFDDEKVNGDLTDTPVAIRSGVELGLARLFDPLK